MSVSNSRGAARVAETAKDVALAEEQAMQHHSSATTGNPSRQLKKQKVEKVAIAHAKNTAVEVGTAAGAMALAMGLIQQQIRRRQLLIKVVSET
jgi:hypothetical protein